MCTLPARRRDETTRVPLPTLRGVATLPPASIMPQDPPNRELSAHDVTVEPRVVDWLLDADASIRWQVMRDVIPAQDATIAAERARVAVDGWGARLLALQGADGGWGDGITRPLWETTLYTWQLLRLMGLDPSSVDAQRAMQRSREGFSWGAEFGDASFFAGETEPCINGGVLAIGAYFGEANAALLDRLLDEQLDDGGWNCNAPQSQRSSFHSTICVLEGLLEYEQTCGPSAPVTAARLRAHDYLLNRRMLRRLATGDIVDQAWTRFAFPTNWHYDVLRGLDYLRGAGVSPDDRADEAVALVAHSRRADGRWVLQHPRPEPPRRWNYPLDFQMEGGDGDESRWITLRALRVLRWYSAHR